jgi:hypothetical protein
VQWSVGVNVYDDGENRRTGFQNDLDEAVDRLVETNREIWVD